MRFLGLHGRRPGSGSPEHANTRPYQQEPAAENVKLLRPLRQSRGTSLRVRLKMPGTSAGGVTPPAAGLPPISLGSGLTAAANTRCSVAISSDHGALYCA